MFPLLEPPDKNHFRRTQSLYRCLTRKAWFRYGPSNSFSKWSRVPSVGFRPPFRSTVATSEPSHRCLFFFLLGRLEAPLLVSSSRFAVALGWTKIVLTASSPEAWLVVMSSSLVVHRPLSPSL